MADLNEYTNKRDFTVTPEPDGAGRGGAEEKAEELIFAVQHHFSRREHYDFRLEWEGALLSWAVPKGPSFNPADKRLAVRVEDHPLGYGGFEGLIPKGEYGAGTVMLWDYGVYKPDSDVGEGLKRGVIKFELFGRRLNGRWALVKLKPRDGEPGDNWLLIKDADSHALRNDGISGFNTSIKSGLTREDIEGSTD